MKSGFDINLIKGDGYLILPLSVSRLSSGQSPKEVYKIVDFFSKKLHTFTNDVIFLYTTGLYLNSNKISYEARQEINKKIQNHSNALRKLIQKKKQYMPPAFHYIPFDYVILNSTVFPEYFTRLKKLEKKDKEFRNAIKKDIGSRKYNEANINFILEEVAVAHILRQRKVELPRTLVRNDIWRLVAYPGDPIAADMHQLDNKTLPQEDTINPFNCGQYDTVKKKFYSV